MRAAAKPPARNVAANAANANNDPQANNDPPPHAPAQGGQGALDAAALAAAGLGEIITIPLHNMDIKSPLSRWIATALAGPARTPITRRHEV